MAASRRMLEMWSRISETPPPDPEPEEEQAQFPGAPPAQPPVEGVSDYDAWALAYSEDGGATRLPASKDELRKLLLLWRDEEPTDAELDTIMTRLPEVYSRGRVVERNFPVLLRTPDAHYLPEGLDAALQHQAGQRRRQYEDDTDRTAQYHEGNPNPPFAAVRGGPAMPDAPVASHTQRPSAALADYLARAGMHPELTDEYRNRPVDFASLAGYKGGSVVGMARGNQGIALSNFLQGIPEHDLIAIAQHEAAHQRGPSNPPLDWRIYDEQLPQTDPGILYLFRQLPAYRNQPGTEHDYTAPFDLGMSLEELPAVLRPFYLDRQGRSLLPAAEDAPFVRMLRGQGLAHGPWEWEARRR